MKEFNRIADSDADIGKIFEIVKLHGHHHLHMDNATQVAAAIRKFLGRI
jgi:hypothetical protein